MKEVIRATRTILEFSEAEEKTKKRDRFRPTTVRYVRKNESAPVRLSREREPQRQITVSRFTLQSTGPHRSLTHAFVYLVVQ